MESRITSEEVYFGSDETIMLRIKDIKTIPAPVKASMAFVICSFLQKGISMICTPIFTRIMSTTDYGVFVTFQSWETVLFLFTTLNMYSATYNKGLIKYNKDGFTSAIYGLNVVITMIVLASILVMKVMGITLIDLDDMLLVILFLEVILAFPYSYWLIRQRFDFLYKAVTIATIIISLISPILGVVLVLYMRQKAVGRILAFMIPQCIAGIICFVVALCKNKKLYNKEYWLFALKFSIPSFPFYLAMVVLQQSDRLMISSIISEADAAKYAVAFSIGNVLTMVTVAINGSLTPYIYKKIKEQEYEDIRKNAEIILELIGVASVFVVLVAPEIMHVFASKDYYEAINVIPPIIVSVFLMFEYSLFSNVSFYFEKVKMIGGVSILGALLNVSLNYIFIGRYGYVAAAYTTLFCYLFFSITHFVIYKRTLHEKNIRAIYKGNNILFITFTIIVLVLLSRLLYDKYILRYVIVLLLFIFLFYRKKEISNVIHFSNNKEEMDKYK